MLYSIKESVEQAGKDFNGNIAELMIATEMELSGRSRDEIIHIMTKNLQVMKNSATDRLTPSRSTGDLTGGDAVKVDTYLKPGKTLSDIIILIAVRNAIAANELDAKMGFIYATPTAGSAGCSPAALTTIIDKLKLSEGEQSNFLFTAGTFGLVIGNNASTSGAEGGYQAEVGSASVMSAATLVKAVGGSVFQASQAVTFVIKNMLGLIYDPVAGLVEVPCVKRNVLGSGFALVAADTALTGIGSQIPADEVADAMYQAGVSLPTAFREIAEGGLAVIPTGRRLQAQIFGE